MSNKTSKDKAQQLYLDHGATSFPKAPGVGEAVCNFLTRTGASPGRASYRQSIDASRILFRTRSAIANLFSAPESKNVIFTSNVTEAINLVLLSLFAKCSESDKNHVITTQSEHNAIMRPLRYLEKESGLSITSIPTAPDGQINPDDITRAITKDTKLVCMLHGSNVTGIVRSLDEISKARKHVPLLIDSAQTAGAVPINLQKTPVDYFCFTGHKSLLGPQGTGGLIIGKSKDNHQIIPLRPLYYGGTGSNSEAENQPDFLPDMLESGTPNIPGIAGLLTAVNYLKDKGIDNIYKSDTKLANYMYDALSQIKGISIKGRTVKNNQLVNNYLPTISLTFDNLTVSEAALRLEKEANIATRMGLHCAPASHKVLNTFPAGTVRLSAGPFITEEDIAFTAEAIERIAIGKS